MLTRSQRQYAPLFVAATMNALLIFRSYRFHPPIALSEPNTAKYGALIVYAAAVAAVWLNVETIVAPFP
jgi:hypothetical protein